MSKATELADEVVRYCPECGLIGPLHNASACCPDSFGMSVRRWQAEKMERMLGRLRGERLRVDLAEPKLDDIEQYRMQMAGISTAAFGYWRLGDEIHPEYDTLALRDVAKLYAKYDALYKANEAMAKDSARYRWLRDKSEPPHNFYISVPVEFHEVRYKPHEVDAYIDAALSSSGDAA